MTINKALLRMRLQANAKRIARLVKKVPVNQDAHQELLALRRVLQVTLRNQYDN